MISRKQRRAVIVSVYLTLFFAVLWVVVSALRPEETCFDNKRNQNEVGVDCGGVCAPCQALIQAEDLQVEYVRVVTGGDGTMDAVSRVTNPNIRYGSAKVDYEFTVRNEQGEVTAERKGTTFVLPAESRYVIELGMKPQNGPPARVDFRITGVDWQEFTDFQKPQITVSNKRFESVSSGTGFAQVYALVRNKSPYDFNRIDVAVVLKNAEGEPLALHKTQLHTMDAGSERDFTLRWPHAFPGIVADVDIAAEANVFDSLNYRKKFLPAEKFQQYR